MTGRKLGIGLRLFGKAMRRGAAAAAASSAQSKAASANPAVNNSGINAASAKPGSSAPAAAQAKSTAKGLIRGTKKFGESLWGPMAHTGGVLWLEITGLFFALFALFFAQNVYKFRASWKSGPDHIHFLIYSALTILFAAFTASQFLKARMKEKKNRARRAAL